MTEIEFTKLSTAMFADLRMLTSFYSEKSKRYSDDNLNHMVDMLKDITDRFKSAMRFHGKMLSTEFHKVQIDDKPKDSFMKECANLIKEGKSGVQEDTRCGVQRTTRLNSDEEIYFSVDEGSETDKPIE